MKSRHRRDTLPQKRRGAGLEGAPEARSKPCDHAALRVDEGCRSRKRPLRATRRQSLAGGRDQPAGLDDAAPVARLLHASRSTTAVARGGTRPARGAGRRRARGAAVTRFAQRNGSHSRGDAKLAFRSGWRAPRSTGDVRASPRLPTRGLVAPSGLGDQPAGLDDAAPVARLLHASRSTTAVARGGRDQPAGLDNAAPVARLLHASRLQRQS